MTAFARMSAVLPRHGGAELCLATGLGATPGGLVDHPVFFSGFLARPDVASAGLLAVADVAMSRYADAGLAQRLANLDPLVTASGDRLRFESFSACSGVHARFDLLPEGLSSEETGFGTTNVDVNAALRTALTRIGRTDLLHLSVGDEALTVSSLDQTYVEERVTLPDRWVQGCAEVPQLVQRMTPAATLRGPGISRFLGELPRVAPPGPTRWLNVLGSRVLMTPHRVPGSVAVTGTSRLRAADRVSRFASRMTVHAGPHDTSAWVLEVPGGRLTLVLSPGPFRGFSGEGGLLTLLADPGAEQHGRELLPHLAWSPEIDRLSLAETTGLTAGAVESGVAWLAACGRVGYDLTEQVHFHRDLPADSAKVLRRSPRLVSAQRLVDRGEVREDGSGWLVRGSTGYHRIVGDRCSCPWEERYAGSRGPCKHRLAVAILSARSTG